VPLPWLSIVPIYPFTCRDMQQVNGNKENFWCLWSTRNCDISLLYFKDMFYVEVCWPILWGIQLKMQPANFTWTHKHTFYFLALLKRLSLHLLIDILNLCRSYLLHYIHVCFVPLPHMMSPIHVTSPVRNLSYTLPGIFATSPGLMMCFNKINLHIHFL